MFMLLRLLYIIDIDIKYTKNTIIKPKTNY